MKPEPQITCQWYSSFSDLEPQRTRWDEFAASVGAPVYMAFDWCATWWEFYGRRRRLVIALVEADSELIGLFPLYIDRFGLPPLGLKIARVVGATDGPTRLMAPPVKPGMAAPAIRAIVEEMLGRRLCDLISLGPVESTYPGLDDLAGLLARDRCQFQVRPSGIVTVYDLSARPDDYLETLGSAEQKRRRYDFRYLERNGAKESVVQGPWSEIDREFQAFARMHTLSWEAKGRPGHFGAWPRAQEYQRTLAERMAGPGRLQIFKIEANGEAICYDYGYVFGRSFFWELPGRSLDLRWAKISLGSCALIIMLRRAVREGITSLYAGVGRYDYKTRLGGEERPVVTMRARRRGLAVTARLAAFELWFRLVEVLYFKFWYMRVQPRLPRFCRRPIWKIWSRMAA